MLEVSLLLSIFNFIRHSTFDIRLGRQPFSPFSPRILFGRPPYGDVDDRVRYVAQALGMSTVIWADNTFDYLIATTNASYVQGNYQAILNKQAAGAYSTQVSVTFLS